MKSHSFAESVATNGSDAPCSKQYGQVSWLA